MIIKDGGCCRDASVVRSWRMVALSEYPQWQMEPGVESWGHWLILESKVRTENVS
jgi:hypothetical protein